jgi:hypothetical protein
LQQYKDYFPQIDEKQVRFWIQTLKTKTLEELHDMGTTTVVRGFDIIMNALKSYHADLQYREIYSKSSDPIEWDRIVNKNPSLIKPRNLPYGLVPSVFDDIKEKVQTLVTTPIDF